MTQPAIIYMWLAENGNIRKWDSKPFPEGVAYALSETRRTALNPEAAWPFPKKAAPQTATSKPLAGPAEPASSSAPCVVDAPATDYRDAARYRWINKQHNFVMHVEGNDFKRQHMNLRCGEPLDTWIDARIAEESNAPTDDTTKERT